MDFPSNSHNPTSKPMPQRAPEDKKVVEKVITTDVVVRKQSLRKKFRAVFFGGDAKSAVAYIAGDVLLPAVKNMIVDATTKGIERVIYGDTMPRRRAAEPGRPRFSYNTPVERNRRPTMLPDQPPRYSSNRRPEASEMVLVSRDEAELVLERLNDIIEKYSAASVADLHDLVGHPSSYVDNKWGWTHLGGVGVYQVREGFVIDLPPVEPI